MLICGGIPVLAATILPGTEIQVRSDAAIDVGRWDRGRIYPAHVVREVHAQDGDVVVPRDSEAELIVRQTGADQFAVDLESITVHGQRYAMDTAGPQYNMPESNYHQGNGIIGAIAGAIAGANGERVQPNGGEIRVPAGSVITFRLQQPLHVVSWNDPGYRRGEDHYHRDGDWYR